MIPTEDDPSLTAETLVYRAYSRSRDEDGRVKSDDFLLRENETTLSIALVPEKALDELDMRGYVPLRIGDIRSIEGDQVRLGVVRKANQSDGDLLEITGITQATKMGFATTLAARAGDPIEKPEHRRRVRANKKIASEEAGKTDA